MDRQGRSQVVSESVLRKVKFRRGVTERVGLETISQVVREKVSEYDQEIPQFHTAYQPTAQQGRATEHI